MISSIYLNTSVANVAKSRDFFSALGFDFNEKFSNDESACLILGKNIFVMLSLKEKFGNFIDKTIADKATTEVIISLECESPDEVRKLSDMAFEHGARRMNDPEDSGSMFSWGFEDLDGHLWDLFWMSPEVGQ